MPALTLQPPIKPPKAPHVTGPSTKKATRPTAEIPQALINEARSTLRVPFDAKRHINFHPPSEIYTMKDIGLEGHGISATAVSAPFPLFTQEAISQIRAEIFSESVLENCRYSSDFSSNMVRGMGRARAPFTHDAWYSPELISGVSQVAGIELVPAFDYEIANINISINDETTPPVSGGDDASAFAWHYDSFPFVCVTMVSDCTGMVGGETAIKLPSGEVRKVRGPAKGTAVVMQGRYIMHQALKAFGGRERIAMVTPFRPKSPFVRDEILLTGSRAISNLSELYHGYTEYRLGLLEERIRARLKQEHQREAFARPFNVQDVREFLTEQKEFLELMLEEIYEVD